MNNGGESEDSPLFCTGGTPDGDVAGGAVVDGVVNEGPVTCEDDEGDDSMTAFLGISVFFPSKIYQMRIKPK